VVAESVERRHRVGAVVEAVAADDVVPLVDQVEKARQCLHRVGVVAVGRDDHRAVRRQHRFPDRDAVALRLLFDHAGTVLSGDFGSTIRRGVHTDHLGAAVGHAVDVREDRLDGGLLVVRSHHDRQVVERVPVSLAVRIRGGVGGFRRSDGRFRGPTARTVVGSHRR